MAKKKTGKKSDAKSAHRKDTCFIIMPFGGWGDDYYETIYRPAIELAGLEPHRADDLFRPSTIVNDIWFYTKNAKLILADLTGKNPNVFYELGLAHALAKPAILVTESMDEVPFDLRALRVILYNKNAPDWGRVLKENIHASIKEVLKAPVAAVLPTFLEVKSSAAKPTITPHEKELLEIKQELDLLRNEVRTGPSSEDVRRRSQVDIGPERARDLIREFVRSEVPDRMIVKRLAGLGPPPTWTMTEIRRARHELNRTKRRKARK